MKTKSELIIQEYDNLESGQVILFLYRLKNLCLDADGSILLSAEVEHEGEVYNIEDVAQVSNPNDEQFCIIPKEENFITPIIKAIAKTHPELKLEVKALTEKGFEDLGSKNLTDEYMPVILATVPPVNKLRHDVVKDAIDAFYNECKGSMDAHKAEYSQRLALAVASLDPETANERKESFDNTTKTYVDTREDMKERHIKALEAAYARYQGIKVKSDALAKEEADAKSKEVTQKMDIFNQED